MAADSSLDLGLERASHLTELRGGWLTPMFPASFKPGTIEWGMLKQAIILLRSQTASTPGANSIDSAPDGTT